MVTISKQQARMIAFVVAKEIETYKYDHPDQYSRFLIRFFPNEAAESLEEEKEKKHFFKEDHINDN